MKFYEKIIGKIFSIGLILLICYALNAQNNSENKLSQILNQVDSLKEIRAFEEALALFKTIEINQLSDKDKLDYYDGLYQLYSPNAFVNYDSALYYIQKKISLTESEQDKMLLYMDLGKLQIQKGDFQESNQTFYKVLDNISLLSTNTDSVILYTRLASTHGMLGQKEKRLSFILQLNELAQHSTDNFAKVLAYNELISYYSAKGDLEEIEKILPIFKEAGFQIEDSVKVGNIAKRIARCYHPQVLNDLDSAEFYMSLASDYLNQNTPLFEKYTLKNELSLLHLEKGNLEKAISLSREGVEGLTKEGLENSTEIQTGYIVLANAFLRRGQLIEAEKYTHKLLDFSRSVDHDLGTFQTLELLVQILKEGDKKAQLNEVYEEMLTLKDSIYIKLNQQKIAEAETRLGLTLKEQQLENQNLQIEQQERQQKGQWVVISMLVLMLGGAFWAYRRINRDKELIAEQNEQLEKSLTEKDFLLKEIHHRVKNNLQIISSLLDKQARNSADNALKKMMREGQDRIQSMALIHQNLYQSENLSSIQIGKYIQELTQNISQSHQSEGQNIAIKINAEPIQMNIDQAIPLGLILNELLTNAFKHAFKNLKEGVINVQFHKKSEEQFELNFSDSGKGMSNDFQLNNLKTLGLNLVNGLVQQLEGTLNVESSEKGTHFNIQF